MERVQVKLVMVRASWVTLRQVPARFGPCFPSAGPHLQSISKQKYSQLETNFLSFTKQGSPPCPRLLPPRGHFDRLVLAESAWSGAPQLIMASSRIFVRGLPPSISEADFKKHFATTGSITDTKLFAHRRIGYVGYQNAAEAEKAVKYFNKTFIRMSKLAVELARPVADSPGSHRQAWHSVGHHTEHNGKNTRPASESPDLKRKRGAEEEQPADPKLQEFLNVMQRRPDDQNLASTDSTKSAIAVAEELVSEDSDEELQTISKRPKQSSAEDMEEEEPPHTTTTDAPRVSDAQDNGPSGLPSSDADWLRSRTNRLLDLNNSSKRDAAEDTVEAPRPQSHQTEAELFGDSAAKTDDKRPLDHAETNIAVPDPSETDSTESKIRESMRLFLRNLSYKTTEDDLRTAFSVFDSLEEVCIHTFVHFFLSRMSPDRDNLCILNDAIQERVF